MFLFNKARLLSASAPHASAWLSVAPSVGLNLHLHSPEFQTAVRWWLGLDTSFASVCPFCSGVALDYLSHHAVSCRHGGDTAIRHNKLCDIIADLRHTCLLAWKQDMVCVVITITLVQLTSLWSVGREANLLP